MTTTTAPSTAHPPATQSAHGQSPNAARAGHGQQQPNDLFSSLLALLSPDAAPLDPLGGEPRAAPGLAQDPLAEDGEAGDNPLAALMAWTASQGLAPAPLTGEGSLTGETRGLDTRADRLGGPAADGQPAANGAPAGRTATALPAGAARAVATTAAATANNPFAPTPSASAPNGGAADAPATRWSRAAAPGDSAAGAWPVRSTVALDTRFQAAAPAGTVAAFAPGGADADELGLPGASPAGGARALGEAAASAVSSSATSADSGLGGEAPAEGGSAHGDSGGDPNSAQDPYAAPADAEAVEVQHWGAGAMRHASLRVGEDAQNAIDIQLALRGDELALDIRTDDAAARELLREQAQAALGERLQQGGLTLGQVSVGEQGQGEARREGHAPQAGAPRGERAGAGPADTAPARAAAGGGSDRGLDLFV